jgi:hypothetical protein
MNTHAACLLISAIAALSGALGQVPQDNAPVPAVKPAPEPRVGVRFEGFLPGTRDLKLAGEYSVDFKIYLSPQGGDPVWSESQRVKVDHGRMDVVLGTTTQIPMSLHEATFKFLGASVNGAREVYPRFTIVNTVYASTEEALRAPAIEALEPGAHPRAGGGAVYSAAGAKIAVRTEKPCTWREALLAARTAGADLADYQDWYKALSTSSKDEIIERSGHYEWVLPWVYDTASHGEYNRLFRGRFQGCDYMDLSPTNKYAYRIAEPVPAESKPLPTSK